MPNLKNGSEIIVYSLKSPVLFLDIFCWAFERGAKRQVAKGFQGLLSDPLFFFRRVFLRFPFYPLFFTTKKEKKKGLFGSNGMKFFFFGNEIKFSKGMYGPLAKKFCLVRYWLKIQHFSSYFTTLKLLQKQPFIGLAKLLVAPPKNKKSRRGWDYPPLSPDSKMPSSRTGEFSNPLLFASVRIWERKKGGGWQEERKNPLSNSHPLNY